MVHAALPWLMWVWIVVFGGVFGSFFTCMVYRVPRALSLRYPPSQCPQCKTLLGVPDLLPILSWLWFWGRCRHCQCPIAFRYLAIEFVTIALGLLAWLAVGQQLQLLGFVPLVWAAEGVVLVAVAKLLHKHHPK
ncbi:MAG: prepilin peptidase [Alphaproteobacteria bacterium]